MSRANSEGGQERERFNKSRPVSWTDSDDSDDDDPSAIEVAGRPPPGRACAILPVSSC